MSEPFAVLELDSGVKVHGNVNVRTDWAGVRSLIESGMPFKEVASHFKITEGAIRHHAKADDWLTPTKVEKLRREIGRRQARVFKQSGKTVDVNVLKAEVWAERGEAVNERAFQIAQLALDGMSDERAKKLIQNPKGFLEVIQAARLVTGMEKLDTQDTPSMAVNIHFLRSQRPIDVDPIEAEVIP